jgi:FkbM family methyltransferase
LEHPEEADLDGRRDVPDLVEEERSSVRDFEAGYLENRKRTRFFWFFVSDRSDAEVDFYITQKNYSRRSSLDAAWAKKYGKSVNSRVPTITLNDLLGKAGVRKIDFLSVDVELAEPAALAGFDIERYLPAFVCIEMHKEVKKEIFEYFSRHDYVLLEKYQDLDPANSYFVPRP